MINRISNYLDQSTDTVRYELQRLVNKAAEDGSHAVPLGWMERLANMVGVDLPEEQHG